MLTMLLAAALANAPVETQVEAPGPIGPLRGTMLAPAGVSRPPVVLILPGSGPTDRNGNSRLGVLAQPYRLLAEALAAQGIATVRIDKRGLYGSHLAVADVNQTRFADYVDDTAAWSAVIRRQTGVRCIWLLGHSEGGLIALASAHTPGICGLILVSAAGRPAAAILREQLEANPANASVLPQAMAAIASLEAGKTFDATDLPRPLQSLFNDKVQPYIISHMRYDPAKLIAAVGKPVLIVQGARDIQISIKDAEALKAADPAAHLLIVPRMNHVLKVVESEDRAANIATYADPALPLAPGLVEAIVEFVKGN